MMPISIEKAIIIFNNNPMIIAVYLCGSYANSTATKQSDIDFAFVASGAMSLMEEMALQAKLSEELHFENIDLINLSKAPIRLQYNLVSGGTLLFEKDKNETDTYIEELLKRYHDREYRYRKFDLDFANGLKEDYCQ